MATVAEIRTAFEAAKRINLSAMELEELEKRRMYAMQEEENLAWARRDALQEGIGIGHSLGREEGIDIGREEGIDIGREEGIGIGREEGVRQQKLHMVQQMLEMGISVAQIAQIAEMSVSDIERIQQKWLNGPSSRTS
ncbi:MAG: hypothetical protein F6K62_27145 [Sphaerospermopsis sp. SIO1G2]|nr:hypothetical protein [Sphaerospermopsis sp. SIO1G2]